MSALQPYPAYKPSGVPWLGDIPAHWQVRRLKFVASVFNSNVDKRSEEGETPVKLCNYIDVYNNERITTDLPFMQATASEREIVKFALRGGDVIITKDSEDWRDIAVPALVVEDLREVICGYHLAVIRPLAGQLDSRYLLRCLQSAAVSYQFQIAATGITRYGLSKQAIGDVVVPCPPLAEQRAITEYLDRETARVDALIARKRALLEQLARWRSAAISHAVTKGLNPDAPLKPSGVPWLGDIPAHWQVRRLKFVAASASEKLEQKPAAVPYLGLENVESWTGKLLLESPQEEVESTVSVFHRGDVLFGKLRPYLAKVVLAEFDGVCSTEFMVLRPVQPLLDKRYLFYTLLSDGFISVVDSLTHGAKMPRASPEQVVNLCIPLPPLAEQCAIAEHLDRELERLGRLRESVETSIALLQRYRTALISAAVTGRVRV
ncbi:MAG: restriction endonuclease subunit S [Anaerolineae bacterium]|nr:restriction endonuclease subunit S [Anaerolineae bacterium]